MHGNGRYPCVVWPGEEVAKPTDPTGRPKIDSRIPITDRRNFMVAGYFSGGLYVVKPQLVYERIKKPRQALVGAGKNVDGEHAVHGR